MQRRELVIFLCVFFAGVGLRTYSLSHSAVEHFDEGVYASNLWFGAPDYAYPLRQLYAPPLLPALIETGMIAGLAPNVAALLPSFLAGCATIAAVWWLGRTWFTPEVGLAAATLCALSDFHSMYSTAALTDVLLGLWIVLAVQAIGLSLWYSDLRWAIAGGVLTGLAWWTKYNGWLPLAIEAATIPVLWLLLRPGHKQLRTWLACFAVTAITAAVVWSPYFLSLQTSGGYGPIASNHARYVVGLSGWLSSAGRQISNQYAIGIGWNTLGFALAWFLPSLLTPRTTRETWRLFIQAVAGALGVSLITGLFPVAVGAVVGIIRVLLATRRMPNFDETWRRRLIGFALVFAWWGGMLVATPFYTSYPRLALPLTIVTWLAASMNWDECLSTSEASPAARAGSISGCLLLLAICGGLFVLFPLLPHTDHWNWSNDRRGLVNIAQQLHASSDSPGGRVIYVFGEPAMLFQLRAAGEDIVIPIQVIPASPAAENGRPIPTLLVAGPHADRDPDFQQQIVAAQNRWQLVREFAYQPSHVVWLDLNDPRRSPKETADLEDVRVYRWRD